MSNWLKIGVPLLVALLLIISTVSITLAVTRDNSAPGALAYYSTSRTAPTQYGTDARCQSCPNYNTCPNAGNGTGNCAGSEGCTGGCVTGTATAQTPPCHKAGYGLRSGSGTAKGGCGSCRTY
jgi:hypothetical protein